MNKGFPDFVGVIEPCWGSNNINVKGTDLLFLFSQICYYLSENVWTPNKRYLAKFMSPPPLQEGPNTLDNVKFYCYWNSRDYSKQNGARLDWRSNHPRWSVYMNVKDNVEIKKKYISFKCFTIWRRKRSFPRGFKKSKLKRAARETKKPQNRSYL